MPTIRCTNPTSFLNRPQARLPHEACHLVLPATDLLGSQLGMDTRATIDLPALLIGLADLLGQPLIIPLTLTGFPLAPSVIATDHETAST